MTQNNEEIIKEVFGKNLLTRDLSYDKVEKALQLQEEKILEMIDEETQKSFMSGFGFNTIRLKQRIKGK